MGSWRFVLSRRWAIFAVVVAVAVYGFWWLGGWQFGRLHSTKSNNQIIRTNEHRSPTPIEQVLPDRGEVGKQDQWRVVSATGVYEPSQTVIVRYQSNGDDSGIDFVVPLVTADGTAVLVDRGFLSTGDTTGDGITPPAPPTGTVTVVGYLRQDGTGSSTSVDDHSTRAISSKAIGPVVGRPVFGGFVDLRTEDGAAVKGLVPAELPDLSNGPHFFYGLQWWFFALLAVFGFFYLMYDEKVNGRRGLRDERGPAPATAMSAGSSSPSSAPSSVPSSAQSPSVPAGSAAGAPGAARPAKRVKPAKPKKVRQSNHPYVRARQEAAARAAAAAAAADQEAASERAGQSARSMPPSTGTIAPDTKDAAGESRNAATRPNSSGSP